MHSVVLAVLYLALCTCGTARAQVTLSPGDIIVAEELGVGPDQQGIVRVDPVTGDQEAFASGPPFVNPLGVAFERSGDLIVTDSFGGSSVLRVDRDAATIAVLSTGLPYLDDPFGVGVAIAANGDIYVAERTVPGVIRIDPVTGTQTLVSTGDRFVWPTGLAIEADGNLIVVDRDAEGGDGAVIRVDPDTGVQSLVTSGGFLIEPTWVAIEANGSIVLAERTGEGGAVIRVNPDTGAQSIVSSGFITIAGIAIDGDGDIIVTDFGVTAVIRVNPTTGQQAVVSQGGLFNTPVGVAVVLCQSDDECDDDNPCTVDQCVPGTAGADAFGCTQATAAPGTICRAAEGTCDAVEVCAGAVCPPDGKSTAICRSADGACDVPESCDGAGDDCPADGYVSAGTTCRAAEGTCDAAEACTGTSASCPNDVKRTTVCRPSGGACDPAESCDGVGDHCPADRLLSGETPCRPSLGECDPTEYCSGSAPNCPYDARSTAVCRPSGGSCDPAESCDGGTTCPANVYSPVGAACASDGNECTRDRCDGAGTCTHPNELNYTVCSDDGASCTDDVCVAEAGQVSQCVHRRSDIRCDIDKDSCTVDVCDPANSTLVSGCRLSAFKAAGTGCDDGNACTQGDKCVTTEGSATACGSGSKTPSGAIDCDGNLCTSGDYCNATTKACVPGTRLLAAGSACDDRNACSTGDRCTAGGACVGTAIPNGQACDDRNGCTTADRCLIGVCGGTVVPDSTPCDDGNRCTFDPADQCVRGACSGGPKKDCATSTLFSPRCQPSTGLCCGKISKKGSTVVCR
jgi:streptogramin lyase